MRSKVRGGFMSTFRMTGSLYHTGIVSVMTHDFGCKLLTAANFDLVSVTSKYQLIYL